MAEIETPLRLALSLRAQPKSFALLLGSGISRAAGVLTGYDVMIDLIHEVASGRGHEPVPTPEDWFFAEYGERPTYDLVLDRLTLSPVERRGLLRRYFEATEEESEQGLKQPTRAHLAIARLVHLGLVNMIFETNFDRLMERALDASGVPYVVASSPGAIESLKPWHLQTCVLVKLHGDYLDSSMLNTAQELDHYAPEVDGMLDRAFDEYGLVVVGWSAAWDSALRHAVERVRGNRVGTYWVEPSDPSESAALLIATRRAVVAHATADQYFDEVVAYVEALEDSRTRDPTNLPTAIARAKRSLAPGGNLIPLHDQVKRAIGSIDSFPLVTRDTVSTSLSYEQYSSDLRQIESETEVAAGLTAVTTYWGTLQTDTFWLTGIGGFAARMVGNGVGPLLNLRQYPATILMFSAGTAAVAAGRWEVVRALTTLRVRDLLGGGMIAVASCAAPERILGGFSPTNGIEAAERPQHHLRQLLRPIFIEQLLMTESDYLAAINVFDYLLTLISIDEHVLDLVADRKSEWRPRWGLDLDPSGSIDDGPLASALVTAAIAREGINYGPLREGLFGGDIAQVQSAQRTTDESFRQWRAQRFFGLGQG